jgi:hypothetical protein
MAILIVRFSLPISIVPSFKLCSFTNVGLPLAPACQALQESATEALARRDAKCGTSRGESMLLAPCGMVIMLGGLEHGFYDFPFIGNNDNNDPN